MLELKGNTLGLPRSGGVALWVSALGVVICVWTALSGVQWAWAGVLVGLCGFVIAMVSPGHTWIVVGPQALPCALWLVNNQARLSDDELGEVIALLADAHDVNFELRRTATGLKRLLN